MAKKVKENNEVSAVRRSKHGGVLTDEEIDLLAKIVWLEANGEPVEGQEAVVEVVLNRMASDLYGADQFLQEKRIYHKKCICTAG